MDINKIIHEAVQKLANSILSKDPEAEIKVQASVVKLVQNMPFVKPLADLHIKANGKDLTYNIVLNGNQLQALPVYKGEK